MEAFLVVWNIFCGDINRFGYQAEHAKSKCGCIRELHNILLRGYVHVSGMDTAFFPFWIK